MTRLAFNLLGGLLFAAVVWRVVFGIFMGVW